MSSRIAIIGGVAGGAGAAAAARRADESAQIDLFEAGPHISFANCGLPYYLSGEIEDRLKLLVTSPEAMARRFKVGVHIGHRVIAIDRVRRALRVVDVAAGRAFDHPYDRLVIATGARAVRPPIPGLDHPRVSECRTLDDVDRLTGLLSGHPSGTALVIGGGFIGVEVAEALTLRGARVTIVDLAKQVLPSLDPEIAEAAREQLATRGVALTLGVGVERLEHGEAASSAVLSDGQRVPFDFAVLSIGVAPDTSLARSAGLEIGATGGLVVDRHQRTNDPNIFAAGDVTELSHWPTDRRVRLALAGPANRQARVAGANAANPEPVLQTSGAAGTSIVRVFDLAVAMTGLSERAAAAMGIPVKAIYAQNGHHAGYFPGAEPLFTKLLFSPADGRVLGAQCFGKRGADKRIDVLATAIQGRFTVEQLADLDVAYSPPFGSAKDPVVIAGMVASNVWRGRSHSVTPAELMAELASASPPVVIDVRSREEHAAENISRSINIPIDELRGALPDVPTDRRVVVHCAVGYRGYLAERILRQSGYPLVHNLSGGLRAWQLVRSAMARNL